MQIVVDHSFLREERHGTMDLIECFSIWSHEIGCIEFAHAVLIHIISNDHQWMESESNAFQLFEIIGIIEILRFENHGCLAEAGGRKDVETVASKTVAF
jgi:hypothetical protein